MSQDIEEVIVEKGMNIWGEKGCSQCGACCYEYNLWRYKTGQGKTEQCENFQIKDGKAYCLAHEGWRKQICEDFFCGNSNFDSRFRYDGDKTLRKIAHDLKTVPKKYKIPVLFKLL